jgi:16S rRNA A1518/A1519 N6-dimethyltransferase RsmA/KsgA/DIM1 with predicted DNA glycosylase/AP lyase activity
LEIGSGKGKLLSRYHQSGYHITGIDIKESQVHESKSLHGTMPVTVMMGDVLGFRNGSFDVVMSFDVNELRNLCLHPLPTLPLDTQSIESDVLVYDNEHLWA